MFVISCITKEDEARWAAEIRETRARRAAKREARWKRFYFPYVWAVCKMDQKSVECARVRYEVERQFLADERQAKRDRDTEEHRRTMEEAAQRAATKGTFCKTTPDQLGGATTTCY